MTSLFVDRRDVRLELDSGAIVFRENGERIGTVPMAPLTRVFIRGNATIDTSLLGTLGENGVGVVILSGRIGKPSLMLSRPHNDVMRRIEQTRCSLDPEYCLLFARELIKKKIAGQVEWFEELRDRYAQWRYELTHAQRLLRDHSSRIDSVDALSSLRGLEGAAASAYFSGLKAVVPDSLGFSTRNRRPPKDPFNALLSLTYTLMISELSIALHTAGFDPFIGFYHQPSFGRESLSCDLLEPLRTMADRHCLWLVREQRLTKDHFSQTSGGCLLGKAGRVRYYEAWQERSDLFRGVMADSISQMAKDILPAEKVDDLDIERF